MMTSRTALLTVAAVLAMSSFVSSSRSATAGGLGLDWLSNKPYVECVQQARMLADVSSIVTGPASREASFDQGRRACNQRFYGHQ